MTEPTTEAGRRLLADILNPEWDADMVAGIARAAIVAIEQEARAAEHDRLSHVAWAQPVISAEEARADLAARIIAAVEGLSPVYSATPTGVGLDRAAVLRAIREGER